MLLLKYVSVDRITDANNHPKTSNDLKEGVQAHNQFATLDKSMLDHSFDDLTWLFRVVIREFL